MFIDCAFTGDIFTIDQNNVKDAKSKPQILKKWAKILRLIIWSNSLAYISKSHYYIRVYLKMAPPWMNTDSAGVHTFHSCTAALEYKSNAFPLLTLHLL